MRQGQSITVREGLIFLLGGCIVWAMTAFTGAPGGEVPSLVLPAASGGLRRGEVEISPMIHRDPFNRASMNENNYRQQLRKAAIASRTANDGTRNIWDLFEASWACSSHARLGRVGDGGKWLCEPERLERQRQCVVYSFGSAGETSFEQAMISMGCNVHSFDPTLDQRQQDHLATIIGLNFHGIGLKAANTGRSQIVKQAGASVQGFMPFSAPSDSSLRSLSSVMKSLGHTRLDVLKVDIESSEWDTFNLDLLCLPEVPADQVTVELHFRDNDASNLFVFMHGFHAHGFRIFHREPNVLNVQRCWEYSFVRTANAAPSLLRNFHAGCSLAPEKRKEMAYAWFKSQAGGGGDGFQIPNGGV